MYMWMKNKKINKLFHHLFFSFVQASLKFHSVLIFCLLTPLSTLFQLHKMYIMATSFSGGGSRSTRREPPTMGKQLINFITSHVYLLQYPF